MKEQSNGLGIASLVLGIVGLVLFIMPYFGIVASIAAIVLGILQRKKSKTGIALAGLIIGIVATVINLLVLAITIWAMMYISSMQM